MEFFFDYIMPWLILWFLIKLFLIPGRVINMVIHPPRYDR